MKAALWMMPGPESKATDDAARAWRNRTPTLQVMKHLPCYTSSAMHDPDVLEVLIGNINLGGRATPGCGSA